MPLFNFQKQFAAAVESGRKSQTIRARRKDGQRPSTGQTAYLYTDMRTKKCRKIGEFKILGVVPVLIGENGICMWAGENGEFCETAKYVLDMEARLDGFDSWESMRDWFRKTYGLPFEGDLIKW